MSRRPQTKTDLRQLEAARTVARPTGNNAVAPTVSMGSGAQLAQALSGIQPALQGYLSELHQDYQREQEEMAYDRIQGMTYAESQALIQSGQMRNTESPFYQAAFEKQFGLAHAANRRREIADAYNNEFDKESGDLDAFLARYAEDDFSAFGDSQFIMAGYREGMAGVFGKIKDQHAEWSSEETKMRTAEYAVDIFRGAVDQANEVGDNPLDAVRARYSDHKEAFGKTFGELDEYVMHIAAEYAEAGDLYTVQQLLEQEVVGEDGTKVGAFVNRARFSEKARNLIEVARSNQGNYFRRENIDLMVDLADRAAMGNLTPDDQAQIRVLLDSKQITQAKAESLLTQNVNALRRNTTTAIVENAKLEIHNTGFDILLDGHGWSITDQTFTGPDGKVHTVSRDEIIQRNGDAYVQAALGKGASTAQLATQIASWNTDYTYQPWEHLLNDGYLALSEKLTTQGPDGLELPESSLMAYQTYREMSSQPNLRNRTVTNTAAAKVYRNAEILEEYGFETDRALLVAAQVQGKPRRSLSTAISKQSFYEDAERAIKADAGWFGSGALNESYVIGWMEDKVGLLMDAGMGQKAATAAVLARYKEDHTVINGVSVPTGNLHIPNGFQEMTERALARYAAENPSVDVDDLTLYPADANGTQWRIIQKDTFVPLRSSLESPSEFTMEQLQEWDNELLREEVNGTLSRRNQFLDEREANPSKPLRLKISPPTSANPFLAPIDR